MSEKNMENSVKEYIKDVKKALPDWLKEKKEHKEVLSDLEEHIWSKAEELSETGQPTEDSVRKAIDSMGTPETIAKEYKRRGTPKVYITAEMWPSYLKVLGFVFAVVIVLNIFSVVMQGIFGTITFESVLDSLASGIQIGLLLAFAIISTIFVVLSMEGYFPEDFKSKKELEKEKVMVREGLPAKPFIKPIGEIIGGGIVLIIGLLLLLQPFPEGILHADFQYLLRFFGIFVIAEGALNILRGIIGNYQPSTHQFIHVIIIIVKLAGIPFLVILMNRPEIFPWFSEPWVHVGIPPEFYDGYRIVMTVLIVIVPLTTIEDIYKIIKLQKYK